MISWRDYLSKKKTQLVAADLYRSKDRDLSGKNQVLFKSPNLKLINRGVCYAELKNILVSAGNLEQLKDALASVIDGYRSIIKNERPHAVLINCTYYLPWCLYVAAKKEGVKKIVIHYHGILKKEIGGYEKKPRDLLCEMEKSFHNENDLVIFPSLFAKSVVEREVVCGNLKNWEVIPNPIPDHFFDCPLKKKGSGKNIGAVIRWSHIKNPGFLERLATYGVKNKKGYKINIVSRPLRFDDNLYLKIKKVANFIEPLDNRELTNFYSRMDLIVCPSFFETYGNVAQESLAAGTPALVGYNMGIAELYRELGLDEWVVDFNDFAGAVKTIGKASFEAVGRSLRQKLRKKLNTGTVFDRLYKTLSRH